MPSINDIRRTGEGVSDFATKCNIEGKGVGNIGKCDIQLVCFVIYGWFIYGWFLINICLTLKLHLILLLYKLIVK